MNKRYLLLLLFLVSTATNSFELGELVQNHEQTAFNGSIKLSSLDPDGYSTIGGVISGYSPFIEKIKYKFERSKHGLFLILYTEKYEVIKPIEITLNLTYRKERKSRNYKIFENGHESKDMALTNQRQKEEGHRLRLMFYEQDTPGSANGSITVTGWSPYDEIELAAKTVDGATLKIKAVGSEESDISEATYRERQKNNFEYVMTITGDDITRLEDTVLILVASRGGHHHLDARNSYKVIGTQRNSESTTPP